MKICGDSRTRHVSPGDTEREEREEEQPKDTPKGNGSSVAPGRSADVRNLQTVKETLHINSDRSRNSAKALRGTSFGHSSRLTDILNLIYPFGSGLGLIPLQ